MINQQDLLTEKFSWQTGYAAFSVSESNVEKVVQYIKNQKSRHQRQTYHDELNSFFNN
jgi:REP element-mobilizing transposase RayT